MATIVQGIPGHHSGFGSYNSPVQDDNESPSWSEFPTIADQQPESSFYETNPVGQKPLDLSSFDVPSKPQETVFKSPYIIKLIKSKTIEQVLLQICAADRIANLANRIYLDYMQLTIEEQKKLVTSMAKMMVWEATVITGVGILEGGAGIGEGFSESVSGSLLKLGTNVSSTAVATACKSAAPLFKRGGDAYSSISRSRQSEVDMVKNNVERIVQGRILEAMSKLSNLSNQYNQSATAILNANTRAQGG